MKDEVGVVGTKCLIIGDYHPSGYGESVVTPPNPYDTLSGWARPWEKMEKLISKKNFLN